MKKGIIVAGIICLMLSGCEKKSDIDDAFNDVQGTDVTVENSEDASETELSEVEEAEHTVKFTVENKQNEVEMTADLVIDTRIPSKVATKKVKQVTIDDNYLIKLSEMIFDGGNYEVFTAKGNSLEESNSIMEGIMDSAEKKAEEYNGVFETSPYYKYLSDLQEAVKEDKQENVEYSEKQIILSKSIEIEGEAADESIICEQKRAFIKGDIDGEPYIVEYTKQDYKPNSDMFSDLEDIMIYPMNGRQRFLSLGKERSEAEHNEENIVSYGDARAMAERFIQQLGLEEYSLVSTCDIINASNSKGVIGLDGKLTSGEKLPDVISEYETKGYRFTFTPAVDGMNISYCSGNERTTTEYDFDKTLEKFWSQPLVQIDVDVTGLRGICMNCSYETEENLYNDSKLISFEKANEIAKQMYKDSYIEQYEVGDIRLEYIVIQYDDENVMAPAWVYYSLSGEEVSGVKFAVNALDGSVVHFSYDVSRHMRWVQ